MGNEPPKPPQHDMRALQPGLLEADDHKIRRVLAVVDGVADPAINQALLDTLRPRLATLRPVRPLRLTRLLFIPLDPLTVPMRGWHPGEAAVPRPVLAPIARIVRSGLGDLTSVIDGIIAGHKADAGQAITQAGELLWPRAAAILATAPPPEDLAETGLPLSAYKPLAASIAAVLRRAPQLRSLALDEAQGGLATDRAAVADILANITNEPEIACAMIARLVLVQSPHALSLLGNIADAGRTADEKDRLRAAVDSAVATVLTRMERDTGFVHEIGHGPLAAAGTEVRRVLTLLREIEADKSFSRQLPHLKTIRQKLDEVCRSRCARGVRDGLLAPLAAVSPVDGLGQTALESFARDLRKLEMTARKVGNPAGYDALLRTASDAVLTAADAGTLTPMRKFRLIEILAGSEAAEALYVKTVSGR
jgi:hypothetical protein